MSDGVSLGGGRGIWEDYGFGIWDLGFGLGIMDLLAFDREQGSRCYYLRVTAFEQTKHISGHNKEHVYALTC